MKFLSSVLCETVLLIMSAHIEDISDIIKDFVAIGFIVEVDDYFAANLSNV